jgi:nucleotide-binding universal stress UspA family protein
MTEHTPDRIVVGIDGSASSDAAVRWAAREAVMRKTKLTLLYVKPPGLPVWGMGYAMAPLPMDYGEMEKEEGQRILAAAQRVASTAVPSAPEGQVRSELVFATPVPTLVDATKDAQMIVVGSRGQGAWRRGLLGSVSTGLIHHAHCPVAVIRADDDGPAPADGPVVLGIDGTSASELATQIAFDEATWRGVDLVAVHAWIDAEPPAVPQSLWPDFRSDAEAVLADRLAGWQDRYPDVTVHRMVVFDQPARHLLDAAESASLVVVGSHGRGGFAGMLLGSVSSAVVHGSRTPVIVARRS